MHFPLHKTHFNVKSLNKFLFINWNSSSKNSFIYNAYFYTETLIIYK